MGVTAKICGLSTEEAVAAASAGGAAYLGFVLYPPSPRAVTPRRATRLCAGFPAGIARFKIDTERVIDDIDPKIYGNFIEHRTIVSIRFPPA